MAEERRCKYCGVKTSGTMCSHCTDKLKRIRIIKAMLLGCSVEEVIAKAEQEK
jgi:hypothetical protein